MKTLVQEAWNDASHFVFLENVPGDADVAGLWIARPEW